MSIFDNLKPGEPVDVPIERGVDYRYYAPDNVVAGQSMAGAVELSFIGFRNAWVSQTFVVESDTADLATMTAQRVTGRPSIVELATVKMSPTLTLDVIGTLAQHMKRLGLASDQEITSRLQDALSKAQPVE